MEHDKETLPPHPPSRLFVTCHGLCGGGVAMKQQPPPSNRLQRPKMIPFLFTHCRQSLFVKTSSQVEFDSQNSFSSRPLWIEVSTSPRSRQHPQRESHSRLVVQRIASTGYSPRHIATPDLESQGGCVFEKTPKSHLPCAPLEYATAGPMYQLSPLCTHKSVSSPAVGADERRTRTMLVETSIWYERVADEELRRSISAEYDELLLLPCSRFE
ncbi:unnamed protein product [Protopolystoma xenopodis]|uniref:Uncharacterized protein n=1 Tax=Protopolystoma xenopodis TaxID=117903 RepID=A0A3S5CIP9_9PLAT|nr:unnamed protein product [Protopolystoma xenopodis]